MYCCCVGTIVDIDLTTIIVEDLKTKERFTCIFDGDESLEAKIGDEGTFVGKFRNGVIAVKKVDVRKFLDPLFEEDMLRTAGLTTLIAPIADPFPEMYLRFKAIDEARIADEQAKEEAAKAQLEEPVGGILIPDHEESTSA